MHTHLHRSPRLARLACLGGALLLLAAGPALAVKPYYAPPLTPELPHSVEIGYDRPGSDYRNFAMQSGSESQCQDACLRDQRCRAWTYVRPGYQGPQARCWLKGTAPGAVPNDCCVSGLK
jgi:hypothetical protein